MSNKTEINPSIRSNPTVVNTSVNASNVTSINAALSQMDISVGTLLNDKYEIITKMNVVTGEADLYVCRYRNQGFVAKVYRRNLAIKADVVDVLKKIESPYVARLYDTGTYNGFPFDILPYYKSGSLQGKRYSFNELKKNIIPSLNEGLHALHQKGLLHKDLKPSNIMLCDNGKDVVIIDFGVSTVTEQGVTVVVTHTGKTPDYSAPETFRNLFLAESDYFSLGITIYELFCGHTPYRNMSTEAIEQFLSVQRIPFPDDMPDELKNLIAALTYYDITGRKNKENPNRRWTYEEVKRWLKGEKLTIPGEGIGNSKGTMPPYTFLSERCTTIPVLVNALAINWNEGKKQLFRGLLSGFFKSFNPQIASSCLDAEEEASKGASDDFIFWKLLYKLDTDIRTFYWRGQVFQGLPALGRTILEQLRKGNLSQLAFYDSIFREKLLSNYVAVTEPKNFSLKTAAEGLESTWLYDCPTERDKQKHLYITGYMLSGQKILQIDLFEFSTVGELSEHIKSLIDRSYEEFEEFCHRMIDYDDSLDVQLEAWLLALGKRKELEQWRESLRG